LHSDRYAHAIENYLETDEHQLASFLQLPANDFVTRNWAPATQEELEQRRIEILQKAKADMDEVIAKNARIDQLGAAFEKHAAAVSQRRLDKIALSMLPRMVDSK
jgi:hypothetical protein